MIVNKRQHVWRFAASTAGRVMLLIGLALLACIISWLVTTEKRLTAGLIDTYTNTSFYEPPRGQQTGKPGELVRSERLASAPDGMIGWRILYHSTDSNGKDIITSGLVAAPNEIVLSPKTKRTVVAWGHPTTGTAQRCAPSVGIDPFDSIEGLRAFVKKGYVVAAPDYAGMGVKGPASFLIGATEGHNMLDAVRAAKQLPHVDADPDVVLWGHSQGGHAALFAGQLAPTYAPELKLKAVAVAAPATNLGQLLQADIGDVSGVTIGSYAFDAYNKTYGAALDTILTPDGAAATPGMASLCLFGQNSELHKIAWPLIGKYLTSNPATTQPWADLLAQNTPGAVKLTAPLFIAQGETDTLVHPEITKQFAEAQKQNGVDVTYYAIPDTGHGLVALKATPKILTWLQQQ